MQPKILRFNGLGGLGQLMTELERVREKHEDNDFGMSLSDSADRESEEDEDDAPR